MEEDKSVPTERMSFLVRAQTAMGIAVLAAALLTGTVVVIQLLVTP
jgi:hypothetical protein